MPAASGYHTYVRPPRWASPDRHARRVTVDPGGRTRPPGASCRPVPPSSGVQALTNTLDSVTMDPVVTSNGRRRAAAAVKESEPLASERDRALSTALTQIERSYGKGAIMRLGEASAQPIEVIPTGALTLDIALGVGGVPRGRLIQGFGPE